jgi:NCS1 family nucleobase:cation symporter-1
VLNIYSAGLCAQTLDWKVDRRKLSYGVGVFAFAFTIFLILNGNFASSLDGWLAGLVTWVAPWAAIMLINYYWVRKQNIDVAELFKSPRETHLVDVSWEAILAFVLGIIATWSFEYAVPTWLQGPAATAIGGIDLSWLAGSIVAGVVYVAALSVSGSRTRTNLSAA